MTASELEEAVQAIPFKPFEIVSADGQRFPVPTPDHFSMSPTKRLAMIWWDAGGHSTVDVLLITHINYVPRRKLPRKSAERLR